MRNLRIDRCLCFDRPFRELKEVADATGAGSIEELQRHVEFGGQCGLCHPYVRALLETGQVEFFEVLTDDKAW